jgi:ABC-type oligopeptide transport system substrate-binding subunit
MSFKVLRLCAALVAVLIAGCGKSKDGESGSRVEVGTREQVLHWANGAEPQDIDPQTVTGIIEHNIIT